MPDSHLPEASTGEPDAIDRIDLARRIGADVGLLFLRVSFGLMMCLGHGMGKLQRFSEIGTPDFRFADPFGLGESLSFVLAGLAEGVASIFIVLGLGTRAVALPLLFTMCVAAFNAHFNDPFFGKPRSKELAAMYGAAFGALMFLGPGRLSLDHLIGRWFRARRGNSGQFANAGELAEVPVD